MPSPRFRGSLPFAELPSTGYDHYLQFHGALPVSTNPSPAEELVVSVDDPGLPRGDGSLRSFQED